MSVTYLRNAETGEFERVGPGSATTDTTLTMAGKPADAAAVGNALSGYALLPDVTSWLNEKSDADHEHTAAEIGALPYIDARSEEYDMDVILASGTHYNTYRFNNTTLNTPYTKGLTTYSSGLIISTAISTGSGKQVAYMNGEQCNYERTMKNGVIGDWCKTYNSGSKPSLSELGAAPAQHTHNVFSSLTEIGITTFPTTMSAIASIMPANSMIIIDTRRINGSGTDYGTETISDWNNSTNGTAFIIKGVTMARVTMLILYGSSEADHGDFTMGNYATNNNTVNWTTSSDFLDDKVDKINKVSAVNLNTLIDPGLYYVSAGSSDSTTLNFPIGTNGHLLVMSDGDNRVRQVFMRLGTADSNNFQWYSRTLHTSTWSKWWLISGQEKVWNGGAVLNDEISIGSRYGCQSWIVVARLQNTGAMSSIVIPRAFLTSDTTLHKFQIADETCFISFYFYYKSDNNVYLKVVDQSDNEYTTLKYVYRTT